MITNQFKRIDQNKKEHDMQIIQNSTGYMRQSNKLIVKQLVLHKMNEFLSVTMFAAIVVAAIVGYFFF